MLCTTWLLNADWSSRASTEGASMKFKLWLVRDANGRVRLMGSEPIRLASGDEFVLEDPIEISAESVLGELTNQISPGMKRRLILEAELT